MEVLEMVRARLFCTVRQDILAWVDDQVTRARFRNRSHAIEYALIKLREADGQKGAQP